MALPTQVLRAARQGFGLPHGRVRVLSTRFGKVCLAHRSPDGTLTQLRLVRVAEDTAQRLDTETRWLTHLVRGHGLRVPEPLPWHDGPLVSPTLIEADATHWLAVACTWVDGCHLDRGLRAGHFYRAGALLARLHQANRDAPPDIVRARPTWWIPRLFSLATTLRDLVGGTIMPPPGVTPAIADGLRRAADALQRAHDALPHDALPHDAQHVGLIHTDAHWQNLRFARRSIGLVDFEDFATGRFMLDLACLWGRVEQRPNAASLLQAMLAGYDAVSPLSPSHDADLRVMLAFRRFDYAGWVLSWPRVDLFPWGPDFLAGTPAYITRWLAPR